MIKFKQDLLNQTIYIFSGEGEQGVREIYNGKKTESALKRRLTQEKCKGDRWAKAQIALDHSSFDTIEF